jgi:hypothetical protein
LALAALVLLGLLVVGLCVAAVGLVLRRGTQPSP